MAHESYQPSGLLLQVATIDPHLGECIQRQDITKTPSSTRSRRTSNPPTLAVTTTASLWGKVTPMRSVSSKVMGCPHHGLLVSISERLVDQAYFFLPECEVP